MKTIYENIRELWHKKMPEYFPDCKSNYINIPKRYLDDKITSIAKEIALNNGYNKADVEQAISLWKSGNLWYEAVMKNKILERHENSKNPNLSCAKDTLENLKFDFPLLFNHLAFGILITEKTRFEIVNTKQKLNELFNDFKSDNVILLSDNNNEGAYDFAINLTLNFIKSDKKVAFLTSRTPKEEMILHSICCFGDIDKKIFEKEPPNKEEIKKFISSAKNIDFSRWFIEDNFNEFYNNFKTYLKNFHRENGFDFLIIDGSELPIFSEKEKCVELTKRFCNFINNLSENLRVPIAIISALPKSIQKEETKSQMLENLPNDNPIKNISDIMIFISCKDDCEDYANENLAEIIISKKNSNSINAMTLHYNKNSFKFYS